MRPPLTVLRLAGLLLISLICGAVAVRPVWKTPVTERRNDTVPLRIPRARHSQPGEIRFSPQGTQFAHAHQPRPYYTNNEDFQVPNYNPPPPRRPYYTRPEDYQIPFYQPQANIKPGRIYRPPFIPPGYSAPRRPFYPQNNPYRKQGPHNQGLYPQTPQVPHGFPEHQGVQYPNGFYPGGGNGVPGQGGSVHYPPNAGFQGPQGPYWQKSVPPHAVPYIEGAESIPPQGAFGPKPPTKSPMLPGIRPETYTGTIPMQPSWNPQDWEKLKTPEHSAQTTVIPAEMDMDSLFTAKTNPYEEVTTEQGSTYGLESTAVPQPKSSLTPSGPVDINRPERPGAGYTSTATTRPGSSNEAKQKEVNPSSTKAEQGNSTPTTGTSTETSNPYEGHSVTEKTPTPGESGTPYVPRPMHPQPVQPPSTSPEFSSHIDVKLLPPTCIGPLCGFDKDKVSLYTPQMGPTLLISNTVKNGLTGGTFMSPVTHMPSPSVPERKLLPFVPGPFLIPEHGEEKPHVFMQPHELTEQMQATSNFKPTTPSPFVPTAKTIPYAKPRTTTAGSSEENPYDEGGNDNLAETSHAEVTTKYPEDEGYVTGVPPNDNRGGIPPSSGEGRPEQPGRGQFGTTKTPLKGYFGPEVTPVGPGGNNGGVPPSRGGEKPEQPGRGQFGTTKNPLERQFGPEVTPGGPGGNNGGVPPSRGGEKPEQPGRGQFGTTKNPLERQFGPEITPGGPGGSNGGGVPPSPGGEKPEQPGRGQFGTTKNPFEGQFGPEITPGGPGEKNGGVPPSRGGEKPEQPGRGQFGTTKTPLERQFGPEITPGGPGGSNGGVPPSPGGEKPEQPGRGQFGTTRNPLEGQFGLEVTPGGPGGSNGGVPPSPRGEKPEQPGRGQFGTTKNPLEGQFGPVVTPGGPGGSNGGVPPSPGGEKPEQPGRGQLGTTKNPLEGQFGPEVTPGEPGGNNGGVPPSRGGEKPEQPGRGQFKTTKNPLEGQFGPEVTPGGPGGSNGGVPPSPRGEKPEQPGRGQFGTTKNPLEGQFGPVVTPGGPGGSNGGVPPSPGGEKPEQPGRGQLGTTKNPLEGQFGPEVTPGGPGGNNGGVPPSRGGEKPEQPGRGQFKTTKNPLEGQFGPEVTPGEPGGNNGGVPPSRGGEKPEQPGRGQFGTTKNPLEGQFGPEVTPGGPGGNNGGVPPSRGGEKPEQPGRGQFGTTKNPLEGQFGPEVTKGGPGGNNGGVPPSRGGGKPEQPGRGQFGTTKNPLEGQFGPEVTPGGPGGSNGGVPPSPGGEKPEQPGRGQFGTTKNPLEGQFGPEVTPGGPGGNNGGVPPSRGGEKPEQPGRRQFKTTKNPLEGEYITGIPPVNNNGNLPPLGGFEITEQPGGEFTLSGTTKRPSSFSKDNELFTTPAAREETTDRFAQLTTTTPSIRVPTYKTKAPTVPVTVPVPPGSYPLVPQDVPPKQEIPETSTTPYYVKDRITQGYETSVGTKKPFVPNRIRGKFRVVCYAEGIEFGIVTIFPFTGSIFANEKQRTPGCMRSFSSEATPSVLLPFKECGRKNPSDNDQRTQYHIQVVVEIEQEDGSTTLQSFMTQCMQQNIKYTKQTLPNRIEETLEELRLVPARLEQKAPLPDVEMKIVVDEHHQLGPEVVEVDIGMPLAIQWSLIGESDAYGFHVKNCFVQDRISGMQMMLIDEHGCSTDVTILHHPHYDTYHDTASAHMWAFKVPDHTSLNIKCDITICSDIMSSSTNISSCASIPSPPYCPDLITSPTNSILFDAEGAFSKRRRQTEQAKETQTVRAALCMGEKCSKVNSAASRLTCVSTVWFTLSSTFSIAAFLLALTINVSVRVSLKKSSL